MKEEGIILGGILFVIICFLVFIFYCAYDERDCIKHENRMMTTYPNMSYLALGPSYAGIAMMPVYAEVDVCVEWSEKK